MFKEVVEVLGTGVSTYEILAKSLPPLKRLGMRLFKQELSIAVLGCGGTGKTTLGKILAGESRPSELLPYEESWRLERFEVDRGIPVLVIVPPGQDRRAGEP